MIRTDMVLTLRDLRGEHDSVERRLPWGGPWVERNTLFARHLLEMAGVVLDWRQHDRGPNGEPAPLDDSPLNLVKDIAEVIRGERVPSLHGADCSLVCTWEPLADA